VGERRGERTSPQKTYMMYVLREPSNQKGIAGKKTSKPTDVLEGWEKSAISQQQQRIMKESCWGKRTIKVGSERLP